MEAAASNARLALKNRLPESRARDVCSREIPFLGRTPRPLRLSLDRPLRTLTTLDRFGLVTWEGREPMLRMLQVDELRRGMGFPTRYRFDQGSRRDKIKMIGNGVCPPVMEAVVDGLTC
jgi:site-specific DNA-cytosine methylase